jgi:sigma-E factor negative regulatory protein RseA
MALATMLAVSLGPSGSVVPAPTLAVAPAAAAGGQETAQPASTQVAEVASPGGRVVRDAQLDHYLRAHRDYATALPGSLPGGSGRSIATVAFER